ncbi:MAG: hypothetical protein K9J84_14560 [Bacteroidia bacterium]|nr:hypothetical protein [Bacteroidia bacterium]
MKDLQKITISARPPVIRTVDGENFTISKILEKFDRQDYSTLIEFCGISIKEIIKTLPSPIITDGSIYSLYFGALAYEKSGEDLKQKACLKILFSLSNSVNLLNDRGIEILNQGIAKYVQISETEGVEELNSIDVNNVKFKSSGCFIASAVYGTPYASEVALLKEFRDNWLLNFRLGKIFVAFYYWISPPIANQIAKSNSLKAFTKSMLIIPLIKIANHLKRKET